MHILLWLQVTTSVKLYGKDPLPLDNYPLYYDQVPEAPGRRACLPVSQLLWAYCRAALVCSRHEVVCTAADSCQIFPCMALLSVSHLCRCIRGAPQGTGGSPACGSKLLLLNGRSRSGAISV